MIAMESTGPYWKPLYNIFELSGMSAMIVNAAHMKALPGRKTDISDAQWIADLLQHGLLRASFVPDREQRELRELLAEVLHVLDEQTTQIQRAETLVDKYMDDSYVVAANAIDELPGIAKTSAQQIIAEIGIDMSRFPSDDHGNFAETPLVFLSVGFSY